MPFRALYTGKNFIIQNDTMQWSAINPAMDVAGIHLRAKGMESKGITQICWYDDISIAGVPQMAAKSSKKTPSMGTNAAYL